MSLQADVYSFGNLFYELLTNKKPFPEHEDNRVADVIAKGGTPEFPANCKIDTKLQKLVKKCWSMDPDDRPSFKKVVSQLEEHQAESAKQEKKRKEKEEGKNLANGTNANNAQAAANKLIERASLV